MSASKAAITDGTANTVSTPGSARSVNTAGSLPVGITSHGFTFDQDPAKLGELRDSGGLAEDMPALRARMADDGYLLLRRYLDRDAVLATRLELAEKLATAGLVDTRRPLTDCIFSGDTSRVTQMDRQAYAKDLRTGPAIKRLCQTGRMIQFYGQFLGGEVLPLNYIWVRNVRVGAATGCHIDWVYMGRGTRNLYTSWTPLGNVPFTDGPLAILEGSHRWDELQRTYGALDVDRDRDKNPYGGGWLTKDPNQPQQKFGGRWLTTEFEPGDLLLFGMFTLHCSLDNKSPEGRIRLSMDTRYQLAAEPADQRWVGEEPFGHGMM